MKKNKKEIKKESKKESKRKNFDALFKRDKAFQRVGAMLTLALGLLLVFGGYMMATAPEEEGLFEGNRLVAVIVIAAAFVIEIGYRVYFSVVHGKVKRLVRERAAERIFSDCNLLPFLQEDARLVFQSKGGRKFILYEESFPSRVLHFSFVEFFSLYEEDTTFYQQTARALAAWFLSERQDGKQYRNVSLCADYGNKKTGVKEFMILQDGAFSEKTEKQAEQDRADFSK